MPPGTLLIRYPPYPLVRSSSLIRPSASACAFSIKILSQITSLLCHFDPSSPPNAILHLSVFVHLCETFLEIPPISLFRYYFRLKPHPKTSSTAVLGRYGIQFRQGKKSEYFDYTLIDSVRDWRIEWFYAGNMLPALDTHTNSGPVVNDRWEKEPLSPAELDKIRPLVNQIKSLKIQGLSGVGIVASWIWRRVHPLKERENYGFQYTCLNDSSRMKSEELSEAEVLARLQGLLKDVNVMLFRTEEYSAEKPPPAVSTPQTLPLNLHIHFAERNMLTE